MACVRMAVACPPYSCQMNSDKVEQTVLWKPGQKVSRWQTLVCFQSPEFDSQLLGGCMLHKFWPGVLFEVWRGFPSLFFAVREAYLSLSIHHCCGCVGDPACAGSWHSARFTPHICAREGRYGGQITASSCMFEKLLESQLHLR